MPNKKKWIILTASLLVLIILLFMFWVARSYHKLSIYDPESYGPYGLKAITLLLANSGLNIKVVKSLPEKGNAIILLSTHDNLPEQLQANITNWVQAGGIVVEMAQSTPVFQTQHCSLTYVATNLQTSSPTGSFFSTINYAIKRDTVYTVVDPETGYFAIHQKYFIYQNHLGKGQIIHWNDPDGIINRNLRESPDNAVAFTLILQSVATGKQLYLYDTSNEIPATNPSNSVNDLFNHYWAFILMLFCSIGLLLWKTAARFGRPRPLQLHRGRSVDEFIFSVANLFQQAGFKQLIVDNLWRDFMEKVSDLYGLNPTIPLWEQQARLTRIDRNVLSKILGLEAEIHRADWQRCSRRYFMEISSRIDQYRKELKRGRD